MNDYISDHVKRAKSFIGRQKQKVIGYKREAERRVKLARKVLRIKWDNQWKQILKYGMFSFAPYVLVYGAITNTVTWHFLNFGLTPISIVVHGLAWYLIKEELFGEMIPELKPTITADVKVKDR